MKAKVQPLGKQEMALIDLHLIHQLLLHDPQLL